MNSEFGEIELFKKAFEENPDLPAVSAYLQTVGLTQEEIEDVRVQFENFCAAIRDAENTKLPDIPNREHVTAPARPSAN